LCGFENQKPFLYQTEPSGVFAQWKANAIGKKSKDLQEYLEKKYGDDIGVEQAVRLSIETLMEVVESEKSIEICVMKPDNSADMLKEE